ncbi:hypothetical protein NL676_001619 [Syzygium grande]|nr:hypothetical protein NL676_001619 [Syzygium grande]
MHVTATDGVPPRRGGVNASRVERRSVEAEEGEGPVSDIVGFPFVPFCVGADHESSLAKRDGSGRGGRGSCLKDTYLRPIPSRCYHLVLSNHANLDSRELIREMERVVT